MPTGKNPTFVAFDDTHYEDVRNMLTREDIRGATLAATRSSGLPYKDLLTRVYLHLPRFPGPDLLKSDVYVPEIARLAHLLAWHRRNVDPTLLEAHFESMAPGELLVNTADSSEVETHIGILHYLESVRKDAISLALRHPVTGLALGVLCISPFDLEHVPIDPLPPSEVRVVSRIYTIDGLPRNAVSYFIGRAFSWVRHNLPEVSLLLTYLNRNVGFSGSAYKASNWRLFAREHGTRYAYLCGNYLTDRGLQAIAGTMRADRVPETLREQLSFSQIALYPLDIWSYPLRKLRLREVQDVTIDWR